MAFNMQNHVDNIMKGGFSMTINDHGASSYAYSLGMAKYGLPDVVVCLPNYEKAAEAVHTYCHWVIENTQFYGRNTGLFGNVNGGDLPVYIKPLHHTEELMNYMGEVMELYTDYPQLIKQGHDPDFVQLLIADANNLLPFESGYNHTKLPQKEFLGLMVA